MTARLVGIAPVVLLPFDEDGSVDVDALQSELDFLVDTGVEWVAFGFGSEVFRLTERELDEVVALTTEYAHGRLAVIVSVRAGSAKSAVQRAEAAAAAGAAAVMLPMPSYVTVSQNELASVYAAVAAASGLGVIVQDAPAMSGAEFALATLAEIVETVPNVLALKIETSASAEKISRLSELLPDAVPLLGGNGGMDFYRELERGAAGTMPSAAFADLFLAIWTSFASGQRAEARDQHNAMLPFLTLGQRDLDTFLWVEKEALRRRGVIPSSRLRDPSVRPSAALRQELDAELDRLSVKA